MNKRCAFVVVWSLLSCFQASHGLVTTRTGPDNADQRTQDQRDWPAGIVELYRHPSRVLVVEGNGGDAVHFNAKPDEINELVSLFAKSRMRDHEIRIKPAKETRWKSSSPKEGEYAVELDVPWRFSSSMTRKKVQPATFEPTLTLYLDPAVDDAVDDALLKALKIPGHVIVNNEVANFPLKGKINKPARKYYYASVRFEDDTPATEPRTGVVTRVTLWEQNKAVGIQLGKIEYKGNYEVALSDQEIANLKSGKMWITLTAGNRSTVPKPDDPKLNWDQLVLDKETAKPVTITKPLIYYGRILFEDDMPAHNGPRLWTPREVRVMLNLAGGGIIDEEGYFGVHLSKAQLAELSKSEVLDIHVPRDRGADRYGFPVAELSPEKAKAGVVRIPKVNPEKDN